MNTFNTGDFIKYKKRFYGIIDSVQSNKYYFIYHNGIKPSIKIAELSELEPVTEEKFFEYVKKKGYTSLLVERENIFKKLKKESSEIMLNEAFEKVKYFLKLNKKYPVAYGEMTENEKQMADWLCECYDNLRFVLDNLSKVLNREKEVYLEVKSLPTENSLKELFDIYNSRDIDNVQS